MKPEELRPISSREEALRIRLPLRPALVQPPHSKAETAARYPLRGTPVAYIDPALSVAEDDWEAVR